ncbi:MAG TPA: M48 family metalloprotease [Vicinamibacteria bacterium]|nr:M48 family metalloprotease [Vicinamibacteria bacterium]
MPRSRLTVSAAAVAAAIACATNPATGKKQLMLVSEAQEVAMGKEADQEAVAAYGLYPDARIQAYVSELGQRLAAKSERPALPWSFKVVDDPAVNAFALPGGYIYVTRGILAHLRSEAELVAVMGHEIGHVTARHSASQMSKQQLAMGGLIVGMAVKPELQRFGDLAQQGLGLLFLKFGRDDENQADELGLRYMTRVSYDPREMLEVFGVLDGVTRAAGGGRMPDWLSTHPSPGNRLARIQGQIAATGASGSVVNRPEYLRRLDGMVFGENPREGFFRENAFYHPDLRFQLSFPRGFQTQNQKQAVVGVSQAQDAMIALTLAAGASPEEAARQFLSQEGVQAGRASRDRIGGLPAYTALFEATTQEGALRGEVSFLSYDGKIYRIIGYTPAARFSAYQNAFDATIRSFSRLTDQRYLGVQPKRLELVNLQRQMALPEFAQSYPSTVEIGTIGLINGVGANQMLPAGQLAKRVVGGRLPD